MLVSIRDNQNKLGIGRRHILELWAGDMTVHLEKAVKPSQHWPRTTRILRNGITYSFVG